MAAGETFRNNNLPVGCGLGENVQNVSLAADNTQIFVTRNQPFIRLTSDNATATNRTFTLTSGPVDGYVLKICLVGSGLNKAELLSTGNVTLTGGTWTASVNDYIMLQWDATSAVWRDISRDVGAGQTLAGRYTPTMTVGANVVSASATSWLFQRVGNIVFVSGQSAVVTTAAANTASQILATLPIASNLAAVTDLSGVNNRNVATGTAGSAGTIQADVAGDRAQIDFNSTATASSLLTVNFAYEIL